MKRNRLELQPDSDDEENILSDDEYEELKKDLAAYTGRRNGGRSERVLQNNIVRAIEICAIYALLRTEELTGTMFL
jgi:hypothetical protein